MAQKLFSAPGNLTDFQTDQQRIDWSTSVNGLFEEVINTVSNCVPAKELQFVNPSKLDISGFTRSDISWSGFPNSLRAEGGPGGTPLTREQAFKKADMPGTAGRDVQDEYLEWFIHREGGEMVAIEFTTETQHYWETLFRIDKSLTAELYSKLTGLTVKSSDIGQGNTYNPRSKFNTTDGIVHLIHGANTLGAELDIACQSTRARLDGQGAPTDDIVDCMRCGGDAIGGGSRNSDPKIASTVSAVAGEGRAVTIPDPVGLYIAKLDTTGWKTPDGTDAQACWTIVRGKPAVRARFEVPGRKFKISDITIGGEKITHAGQIAEQVFVKLTAALGPKNQFTNRKAAPCQGGVQPAAVAPSGHRRSKRAGA